MTKDLERIEAINKQVQEAIQALIETRERVDDTLKSLNNKKVVTNYETMTK